MSKNYKYAGSNDYKKVAWYKYNTEDTHDVGSKKSNELGIYNMSGNVTEWCWDRYGNYITNPQNDPYGPDSGSYRVYRGGGWNRRAYDCRVTYRGRDNPHEKFNHDIHIGREGYGLRLCRSSK